MAAIFLFFLFCFIAFSFYCYFCLVLLLASVSAFVWLCFWDCFILYFLVYRFVLFFSVFLVVLFFFGGGVLCFVSFLFPVKMSLSQDATATITILPLIK